MKKIRTSLMLDSLIGLLLTILTLSAFYFSWTPLEELEYRFYDLGSNLSTVIHKFGYVFTQPVVRRLTLPV
jgi:hypothetical protein